MLNGDFEDMAHQKKSNCYKTVCKKPQKINISLVSGYFWIWFGNSWYLRSPEGKQWGFIPKMLNVRIFWPKNKES